MPWARESAPDVQDVMKESPMIPDAGNMLSAPGRMAGFSEPGSFDMTCRKHDHGVGNVVCIAGKSTLRLALDASKRAELPTYGSNCDCQIQTDSGPIQSSRFQIQFT